MLTTYARILMNFKCQYGKGNAALQLQLNYLHVASSLLEYRISVQSLKLNSNPIMLLSNTIYTRFISFITLLLVGEIKSTV